MTVPANFEQRARLEGEHDRTQRWRLGVVALLVLALASAPLAAGGTAATSPAAAATKSGNTAIANPTPSARPFPQDTRPKFRRSPGGKPLVFTDIRVAERKRFDRVVVKFSGRGTPGWAVSYNNKAVLEGSGDVVRMQGDSILTIVASNSTWPAPNYYSGPRRLDGRGGIAEVYVAGTIEGDTQVFAGIDGRRAPSRVFALTRPTRLVVDVARDGRG